MSHTARYGQRLNDHKGLSQREIIGDGEVDLSTGPRGQNGGQPFGGAPGQCHGGLARGQIHHPHVAPEDALIEAGSEGFGAGFLGSETFGVRRRALLAALRSPHLDRSKDPFNEALAIAVESLLDAPDIDEVAADADDHRAAAPAASARAVSIRRRMVRTLSSRPTKIASPMR